MTANADGTVTLTSDEYDKIQDDLDKLAGLEEMGVDNWEGYHDAMQRKRELKRERMAATARKPE